MRFDTRTLAAVSVVVALVPGIIGALVWQSKRTYPGRWVLGNLLTALTLFLLSLRGSVPDFVSIVLANGFGIVAAVAFLQGIRRFRGLPTGWWQESLVGIFTLAAVIYFRYVTDNINARILAVSLGLGGVGIACGVMLLKEMPRDRRTGFIITGLVFAIGGALNLVRGLYIFSVAPVTSLFDDSPFNALLFLGSSLGVVSWSLGFIVLTAERLGPDSKQSLVESSPASNAAANGTPLGHETVSEEEVRQQLARIVDSDMFRRSTQMVRFLTLVVDRGLAGHFEDLKEYALGRDVFHRGEDYDPRTDSIVRVEAQRLRRKLREYYESKGSQDPVFICLPAGSYVPIFKYLQSGLTDQLRFHGSPE